MNDIINTNYIPECVVGHKCFCGEAAHKKVEEVIFDDDPMRNRHPLTNWVCLKHFEMIMKRT